MDQYDQPTGANEREDKRRRPPPADATSESVDRATLALSTIQRGSVDCLAADATNPSDDERRDELTRWAETNVQDSQARDGGDEGLDRSR